tara:strand:+ start:1605 stop:4208 length:2604 start_codon:yes stop_codon:yes gene_type:complete
VAENLPTFRSKRLRDASQELQASGALPTFTSKRQSTLMPTLHMGDDEFQNYRTRFQNIPGHEVDDYVPLNFQEAVEGKSPDEPVTAAGKPGLADAGTRYLMGRASTLGEKAAAFKKRYPEGDLVAKRFGDSDKYELAYRKEKGDNWSKVDAKLGKENILYDLAELGGEDLEAILLEIWGATKAVQKGIPINLLRLAAYAGAGTAAGELAKEGVEVLRGTQEESLGDVGKRATTKGVVAGIAAPVGEVVVRKGVDLVKGGGWAPLKKGTRQVLQASEDLGVPAIPVHRGVSAPWVAKLGGQSQALFAKVNDYIAGIKEDTKLVLSRLSKAKGRTNLGADLARLEKIARGRAIQAAGKRMGQFPRAKVREFGAKVGEYIKEWDAIANANVNNLYRTARLLDEPTFDLTNLQTVARNILDRGDLARRFRASQDEPFLLGPDGQPLPVAGEEQVIGTAISQLDANAEKVLREIAETTRMESRVVDGETVTPLDQLNWWAETLGDAMVPPVGQRATRENKLAGQAFRAIRDTLDNPDNLKGAAPGFAKAWKAARKAANDRFKVLERSVVKEAIRTESPDVFVRRIISGSDPDLVLQLKRALKPERFDILKTAFRNDLMTDPDNLTKRLADFSPEFRRTLLSDTEFRAMRNLGQQIDKVNQVGIRTLLDKQSAFAKIVDGLVRNSDSLGIETLGKMIGQQGGRDSPIGRTIRASIIDSIYRRATRPSQAGDALGDELLPTEISSEMLGNVLKEYGDSGVLKLLDPAEIKALTQVFRINKFLDDGADAGTSIMGAQTASGLRSLSMSAFVTMAEAFGVGRFLISPIGRRLFLGTGAKTMDPSRAVAATAGSLALMAQDSVKTEKQINRLIEANQ